MLVLLITIIFGALFYFDYITVCGYLIVVFASIVWMYASADLYFRNGFFKEYYHDLLGWHVPDGKSWSDGLNEHAVCKHCGKHIMQDSQGNWF